MFTGILIGVCVLGGLAFFPQLGIPFGAILLLIECTLELFAAAFCAPSTFNLTNGLAVSWTPSQVWWKSAMLAAMRLSAQVDFNPNS